MNELYQALSQMRHTRKSMEEIKNYILQVTNSTDIVVNVINDLAFFEDYRLDWSVAPHTTAPMGSVWFAKLPNDNLYITDISVEL